VLLALVGVAALAGVIVAIYMFYFSRREEEFFGPVADAV